MNQFLRISTFCAAGAFLSVACSSDDDVSDGGTGGTDAGTGGSDAGTGGSGAGTGGSDPGTGGTAMGGDSNATGGMAPVDPCPDGTQGCECRIPMGMAGSPSQVTACDVDLECFDGQKGETCEVVCASPGRFANDDDVADFAAPGCSVIDGDLSIGGKTKNPLTLGDLSSIKEVVGSLTLRNTTSIDLSEFSGLQYVGDRIGIYFNTSLTTFAGLTAFDDQELTGNLSVFGNAKVTTLEGLESLTTVGAQIRVSNNILLENLSGLSGLMSVDELDIDDNTVLPQCLVEEFATQVGQVCTEGNNSCTGNDEVPTCN